MAMPRRNNSGPMRGWFSRGHDDREGQRTSQPPALHDEQASDHEYALAHMIWQVNRSTSPVTLAQFARRRDYGQLIWDLRVEGWKQRMYALQRLGSRLTTPDPLKQSTWTTRDILRAALAELEIPVAVISTTNGMAGPQEYWSEKSGMPIFAWIMTWTGGGIPYLAYDLEHQHRYAWQVAGEWKYPRIATVQAAMCLGALVHSWDYYTGYLNGGKPILPPNPQDERCSCVPLHAFMKSLLALGNDCPPPLGCECNTVAWEIQQAANAVARQRQGDAPNTDILPPYAHYAQSEPGQPQQPQQYPPRSAPRPSSPFHARVTPELPDGDDDEDDAMPDEE